MRAPAGWVAAALVVGGLTAAPAAAEPYVLTVFGNGSTYADVTTTTTYTFDPARVVVVTTGRYAGFAVATVGRRGRMHGGVLSSDDLAAQQKLVALGSGSGSGGLKIGPGLDDPVTLPPGRYRFFLFTDGYAEVRAPLSQGSGLDVHTRVEYRHTYVARHRTLEAGQTSVAVSAPLPFAANRYYLGVSMFRTHPLSWLSSPLGRFEHRLCYSPRATSCARGHVVRSTWRGAGDSTNGMELVTRTPLPPAEAGIRHVRSQVELGSSVPSRLSLVALEIPLS